ncbi:nitrogen regulation protein NR(II) [Sphingomonas baiyangensis]|uniref:PAS domain-containing protein n=1 Tax=Sphingomonas baiyangensis TaxID=2572576 RepID=A0A4U1L1R5_9SPHN|nr:hypothetical protein [Sphingomonas baiyangensis]TKD50797.1 hypothetical protein FBR43_08460 [Sphingomonas baiyangensis]
MLTSFDLMTRLCAPAPERDAGDQMLLLDSLREPVLAIDTAGIVTAANRAARIAFAVGEHGIGQSIYAVLSDVIGRFILDLAERARRTGTAEHSEFAIGDRQYLVTLLPHAEGALLVADDATADTRADAIAASHSALERAIEASGTIATARLNLRGYIADAAPTLATLTGTTEQALRSVRFVTLFDVGARVRVGDAIEQAIGEARTVVVDARLQRARGPALDVQLTLAAERERFSVAALRLVIVPLRSDQST